MLACQREPQSEPFVGQARIELSLIYMQISFGVIDCFQVGLLQVFEYWTETVKNIDSNRIKISKLSF